MRMPRFKSPDDAFYHTYTRIAGSPLHFPFHRRQVSQKLIELLHFFLNAYCAQLVSFTVMGNHYHLILFFEQFRILSPQQLRRRAQSLYGPRFSIHTRLWSDAQWLRFNQKLFDISSFMQRLNGSFAQWFNSRFHRRGHLWADRFKNPILLDLQALQDCLFYIELNPVRARKVRRPDQWKAGSAFLRFHRQDHLLFPLEKIFPDVDPQQLYSYYRAQLYWRAKLALGEAESIIWPASQRLRPGLFLEHHPFFTQGLAIAGGRRPIQSILDRLTARGIYCRGRPPAPQLSHRLFSVVNPRPHQN